MNYYFVAFVTGFIVAIITIVILTGLALRMMDKPRKDYEAEKKRIKKEATKKEIKLDGIDDYLEIPDNDNLNIKLEVGND